jgi:hypothetical protein
VLEESHPMPSQHLGRQVITDKLTTDKGSVGSSAFAWRLFMFPIPWQTHAMTQHCMSCWVSRPHPCKSSVSFNPFPLGRAGCRDPIFALRWGMTLIRARVQVALSFASSSSPVTSPLPSNRQSPTAPASARIFPSTSAAGPVAAMAALFAARAAHQADKKKPARLGRARLWPAKGNSCLWKGNCLDAQKADQTGLPVFYLESQSMGSPKFRTLTLSVIAGQCNCTSSAIAGQEDFIHKIWL